MDAPSAARAPGLVEYGELPELTRGLRALGSSRLSGGARQSQFFLGLLEARRRAEAARDAASRVHAFNPAELSRSLDHAIERILAEWPDKRASARRALRAELLERVAGYALSLKELTSSADLVLAAPEKERLQRWRDWTTRLAAAFEAADRGWVALRAVVDSLPASGP